MNEKIIAKKHCANYGKSERAGICGGLFFRRDEDGRLIYWIDEEYHNKECEPKDCSYFKNIVLPGVK